MTIRSEGVRAVSLGELLDPEKFALRIPPYQRPYSWEPETALQLVDDVAGALARQDDGTPYVVGAIILHRHDGDQLDVVDGQQRLLTLHLMLNLLDGKPVPALSTAGENAVSRVYSSLRSRLASYSFEYAARLSDFVRWRCEVVTVETDDVDEAFRVFDSQNYRGKPLAPHDLLKAHHLREMKDESPAMKSAVVEDWESVRDKDLDRLFAVYLYRIARWSKGQGAPGFSVHDIGMFKGISASASSTPANRYHLAAQAAIPMMDAWGGPDGRDRDRARVRFQLDAPIVSGRPFFEMVSFMLAELRHLADYGFSDDLEQFRHLDVIEVQDGMLVLEERAAKGRYRYVGDLYLAALLYYTNRFGDLDLEEAKSRLFAWAFRLRAELRRVQYRSVDNRGRGDSSGQSAFALVRDASSGRALDQLQSGVIPFSADHEVQLVGILKNQESA